MYCNVTLTAEEFKVLHNSLCDLNSFCQFKEIKEIVERIRKVALKSAYDQDNTAFKRKHDHYSNVREQYGLRTNWSIYEVDDLDLRHPYQDAAYVVYTDHWGDTGEIIQAINGPTWVDLYRAADAAIRRSGDGHHCFIEDFQPLKDDPTHLRLRTGS